MIYLVPAGLFLIALGCLTYVAFQAGYNTGWEERQRDMVLPRRLLEAVNKDLDDRETHHRHSALDPKKAVWH